MSPISRRAFLGAVAAIPAAAFLPHEDVLQAIRALVVQDGRVIPIIFGDVPREWLTLPYYRAQDEWDLFAWSNGVPQMTLITAYDQDPALAQ